MTDPYYLPGTKVFRNSRGITDAAELADVEGAVAAIHIAELAQDPIDGQLDFEHLRSIHRAILADLYDWAGQIRLVDTQPGELPVEHDAPERIPDEARRIFGEIADGDFLRGRTREDFARGLGEHWGDMTCLHPFRDGNSRSQRVFFDQLAREAGWAIDWRDLSVPAIQAARNFAYYDGGLILADVLEPLIKPPDQVPAEAILAPPIHTEWTLNDHWHAMVDHATDDTDAPYAGPARSTPQSESAAAATHPAAQVNHREIEHGRSVEVHRQQERHAASRPVGPEGPRL